MLINLNDIFETQKILDATIHKKHQVSYKKVFAELKLALLVELGELANEVRSFKFWSIKLASEKKIILEEYVDGIHFITSICIYLKVGSSLQIKLPRAATYTKKQITNTINKLFSLACNLTTKQKVKKYYEQYLSLAFMLGFNFEDIKHAYFRKNQINFQRQKESY
ncbi:MAG: dUTP diphosphatase [Mycoplasmataceae bacterium]|nr:dUTP diphosphatase [Mycoplasmataceae bacterium]